jgi:hypothetical protein
MSHQPLVLARKLGHPELFFDENKTKSLNFTNNAACRWSLEDRDGCWICQKWKYTVVFADTQNYSTFYSQITDKGVIDYLKLTYRINEND